MNKAPTILAVAALLALTGAAFGQTTRTWRNPTTAAFTNTGSWVGSTVPASNEIAAFGLTASATPFAVTFSAARSLAGLTVNNQRPTLNLGGFGLTLTGGLSVGGTNAPALTISNGTLSVATVGGETNIGNNSGRTGSLLVTGAGTVINARNTQLGRFGGQGSLTIENGAVYNSPEDLAVRNSSAAIGNVTIRGTGSQLNTGNIGSEGAMSFVIDSGGTLNVTGETNQVQNWTVDGAGSRANFGNVVRLGGMNQSVIVQNGGAWGSGTTNFYDHTASADTTLNIDVGGAGSLFAAADFSTGSGATAIRVTSGGRLTTRYTFQLGGGYVATPQSLLVRGAGSQLICGTLPPDRGDLLIGYEHSNVSATIEQGGSMIANRNSFVGHRGQGTLTVDGTGSSFSSPYRLHVGWGQALPASSGTVIIRNGATASLDSLDINGGTTGQASLLIEGSGTLVTVNEGGSYLTSGGLLTIRDGAGMEMNQWLDCYGTPDRTPELRLASGGYLFTSGLTLGRNEGTPPLTALCTLDGGSIVTNDINLLRGGSMRGSGAIQLTGRLAVWGTLTPGLPNSPIGEITITDGRLQMSEDQSSNLSIDVGGTIPGIGYDRVLTSGRTDIAGKLALNLVNGFIPAIGQTFDIISTPANQRFGQFTNFTGTDLGGGKAFVITYPNNGVRLTVDGVTGIDITQTSVAVAQGFKSARLIATANYSASNPQNVAQSVTWTSDNNSIATVNADGSITGTGPGTTIIRGSFSGFTDSVSVTVRPLPGNVVLGPGLQTTLYSPFLPELDQLTPAQTGSRPMPSFNSGELQTLLGRTTPLGARLTGQLIVPTTGEYSFHLGGNNVSTLWIDGRPLAWGQSYYPQIPGVLTLSQGLHDIRVDVGTYDNNTYCAVDWSGPGIPRQPLPSSALSGGALAASYYDLPPFPGNQLPNLSAFHALSTGTAANIDLPLYPNGYLGFRMQRFNGFITIPDDAAYTFTINVDDAAEMWIDNQLVIDTGWNDFRFNDVHTATRTLAKGVYPFRVNYTEHRGNFGGIQIRMSSAGIVDQAIPPAAFSRIPIVSIACSIADVAGGGAGGLTPDGTLDGNDFIAFINSFATGDLAADGLADVAGGGADGLTPDGIIDGADFIAFINAFAVGC